MEKKELEKLYGLYYERVYSFLRKLSGDEKLSEDLAQETFVLVFLKLPEEPEYIAQWLYRVARNLYIDWVRKNGKEIPAEPFGERTPSDERDPLALILQKEESEILRKHLKKLSLAERKMIECFYQKGLSGMETAALLGVSPGSVRVTLHRARAKLMKEIKKEE